MKKIADYQIFQFNPHAREIKSHPIKITIWEHGGNRIEVTYHPTGGYFAFINNDKVNFGHSKPNNPSGIIIWVLRRLGITIHHPENQETYK